MREISRVLSVAVSAELPVYLRGAPGIGKTAIIRAIGEKLGYHVETVIASLHDPTDFSGLPVKVDGKAVFAPPEWAVRLVEKAPSILFLDEISTAPPAVQAAALRVVHERVVGYLTLPRSVRIVAAGNEASHSQAVWDLTPPLANRFLHLPCHADVDEVADYFLGGAGAVAVAAPQPGWEEGIPAQKALVAAFLRARPSLLHAMPEGEAASGPWPSPRTWEMVAVFLAAAAGVLNEDEMFTGIAGCVGPGAAKEFMAWGKSLDIPEPEEILSGKASVPPRPDRAMAALARLVAYVCCPERENLLPEAYRIVGEIGEKRPELMVLFGKRLEGYRRSRNLPVPKELEKFVPILKKVVLGVEA